MSLVFKSIKCIIKKNKNRFEEYFYWYNRERTKEKLAGLSPVKYRTQSSQTAV
ncbi:IS3 family transposase [Oceanobacillus sojae]|uniref:IS3 family transposase n=1 Tax=Oceanobacillus sojae TaxID=582851 RepID=UPI0011BD6657